MKPSLGLHPSVLLPESFTVEFCPRAPSVAELTVSSALSRLPVASSFLVNAVFITIPERFRGGYAFGGA
ncbi:hypothetical protein BCL69_1002106 [Nitrosomonas communis]|uniref:Uncharacterized protein n=1 Tax=Nitrosomonas communis TaxID=44574 RepID=A0A1H2QSE0_9PROT|nr:hypothetical protein BCL69_1002106 [Nitrosomonas communis]SDW10113.1 hypothetical protein SAMN05421882_10037 [Nitrosomonas communis]